MRMIVGCVWLFVLLFPVLGYSEDGVLVLDETVVRGKIQKPEAFYILQNAELKYEELGEKRDFLPEIIKDVERKNWLERK